MYGEAPVSWGGWTPWRQLGRADGRHPWPTHADHAASNL